MAPFQEYAAAQAADAKLFTPPPSVMYRRPASDRNYEFWGDQTFFGENPPQAAVIAWHLKKDVGEVKLTIADALGKQVREISGPGAGEQQQGRLPGRVLGPPGAAAGGAAAVAGSAGGTGG